MSERVRDNRVHYRVVHVKATRSADDVSTHISVVLELHWKRYLERSTALK